MIASATLRQSLNSLSACRRLLRGGDGRRVAPFAYRMVALNLCFALVSAATPYLMGLFVDAATGAPRPEGNALLLIAAFFAASSVLSILNIVRSITAYRLSHEVRTRVTTRYAESVIHAPPHAATPQGAGKVSAHLAQAGEGGAELANAFALGTVPMLIELAMATAIVTYALDWMFLAVFLTVLTGAALVSGVISASLARSFASYNAAQSRFHASLTEIVSNIDDIRAFSAQPFALSRLRSGILDADRSMKTLSALSCRCFAGLEVFALVGMVATGWLAEREMSLSRMSVGELVIAGLYYVRLVEVSRSLLANLKAGIMSVSRIVPAARSMADEERAIAGGPLGGDAGRPDTGPIRRIALDGVSCSYDGQRMAVREAGFSLASGQWAAIIGPSGSGKTSLARIMTGRLACGTGRILVNNADAAGFSPRSLCRALRLVSQEPMLFADSVRNNILLGRDADEGELRGVLAATGLDAALSRLGGLDLLLEDRGRNLSAGQRQRVALARALLENPDVLILDESTSALDSISEQQVLRNIRALRRDRVTVIITHRLATIGACAPIIVMTDGVAAVAQSYDEALRLMGPKEHRPSDAAPGTTDPMTIEAMDMEAVR